MEKEVIAALVGALVAGLFALVGGAVGFLWQQQQWVRERLLAAYSNSIYYLFKLSVSSQDYLDTLAEETKQRAQGGKITVDVAAAKKDLRQHLSESQRHLALLLSFHDVDVAQGRALADALKLLTSSPSANLPKISGDAANEVRAALATDSRVKARDWVGTLGQQGF